MLRLQFALWRRDIAIRQAAVMKANRRWSDNGIRETVLDQRARRWERIAQWLEGRTSAAAGG